MRLAHCRGLHFNAELRIAAVRNRSRFVRLFSCVVPMVMRGEMVACATFCGGSAVDEIIRVTNC